MAVAAAAVKGLVAPEIWWLRSLEARVEESWSNWKGTLLSGLDSGVLSERSPGLRSHGVWG